MKRLQGSNAASSFAPGPGVFWKESNGIVVVMREGESYYQELNDTASHIWTGLMRGDSTDDIVATLTSQFRVSAEEARRDITACISELRREHLLQ